MHRAGRQHRQLITEALEIAQPKSAGNFAFYVSFLVTRLQLLEMLNTLDFKGSGPAVYLHKAVLPCKRNRSTMTLLNPGRTASVFQYWLNGLDYSSMIPAHCLTPAALRPTHARGKSAGESLMVLLCRRDTPALVHPGVHPSFSGWQARPFDHFLPHQHSQCAAVLSFISRTV